MIYTNWRGKEFVIDEKFAREFREYLISEGESPSDVAYLTPEKILEELPDLEREERISQLEEMWESDAKANTV